MSWDTSDMSWDKKNWYVMGRIGYVMGQSLIQCDMDKSILECAILDLI